MGIAKTAIARMHPINANSIPVITPWLMPRRSLSGMVETVGAGVWIDEIGVPVAWTSIERWVGAPGNAGAAPTGMNVAT